MPGRHADTSRRQQLSPRSERGGLTLNALAAALCLGIGLGVVAYMVALPTSGSAVSARDAWRDLLPAPVTTADPGDPDAPTIVGHPAVLDTATSAGFSFTEPPSGAPFACRFDGGGWAPCRSPVALDGLDLGDHAFLVRGEGPAARDAPPALYPWTVVESRPVRIEPQLSTMLELYPGGEPVVAPVRMINPNDVPIAVTGITVAVGRDPPGCPSATNLELIPSNASPAHPLRVRAHASVWLPGQGFDAPAIRLRDLGVSQDACEDADFSLAFSGTAHG